MVSTTITCDKCKNAIDGVYYTVSVNCPINYSFIQMPKYIAYDLCADCMKDVIDDTVVGRTSVSQQYCASTALL